MNIHANKIDDWSFYILAFLALVLVFSTALAELASVILIILWVGRLLIVRDFSFKTHYLFVPIALWILLRIVSIVFSTSPELSQRGWEKVWIPLLYFPIASLAIREKQMKLILLLLLGSSILATLWGSYQVLTGSQLRAASLSSGYYTLGVHLCLVLALLLSYLAETHKVNKLFPLYLCGVILVTGIFFTYSRACYLATVGTILILTIFRQKKIFFFLVPLLLLFFLGPQERFSRQDKFGQVDYSTGRFQIWQAGLSKLPETPLFGYGPNTFRTVYPEELRTELTDQKVKSWHNDFLQIFLESGPLALLSYLLILLVFLKSSWRNYRAGSPSVSSALQLGVILIILDWVWIGLFANLVGDPLNSILFWSSLGLAQANRVAPS